MFDELLFQTTLAQEVRLLATYVHDQDKWLAELAALTADLADMACLCVHLAGADGSRLYLAVKHRVSPAQLRQVREVAAEEYGRDDPLADTPGLIHPSVGALVDEHLAAERFASHCAYCLHTKVSRLGSLAVYFDSTGAMTSEVRDQLALLAQQFAPVAGLAVTYREMQQLSVLDNLTLLFHQRYFEDRLAEAFDGQQRHGRDFAVMIADVDYLGRINEQHGHATGDAVLRLLAQQLRAVTRRWDVLARTGDDELSVLLPDATAEEASAMARKFREQVAGLFFGNPAEPVRVTVSIGVAAVTPRCTEGATVFWEANAAVCEAKQAGRDTVRAFKG